MNYKIGMALAVAMLAVSLGETCLSRGMREIGPVSVSSCGDLWRLLWVVFRSRAVFCGVVLLGLYFYMFLSLLSWADLSYVLPLTSVSFILGALSAHFLLHERVSPARWIGTIIVCAGVALIAVDNARLEKAKRAQRQDPPRVSKSS